MHGPAQKRADFRFSGGKRVAVPRPGGAIRTESAFFPPGALRGSLVKHQRRSYNTVIQSESIRSCMQRDIDCFPYDL